MDGDGSNRRPLTTGRMTAFRAGCLGVREDCVLHIRHRLELHLPEIEMGETQQILLEANAGDVPLQPSWQREDQSSFRGP